MFCLSCHRIPSQVREYRRMAKEEGFSSPEDAVRNNEDTWDPDTQTFCCTTCYINLGYPTHQQLKPLRARAI